ncbi:type 1 glutamine amidotransferase [Brevundimonas bacteroides]|uniref:type 1 glutamine amidotransferase n=1 Tax=Brevundimonas bacteroides TaxID=74311 RepID=UPI000496B4DF|nr:glutamine amidotransferase [Brevundimonas bacteroides]
MPTIAVLETGRPPAALSPAHGDYPSMFAALLGEGFDTRAFDIQAGDLPDITAFDGAIITGSAAGVYEDHAWIPPLLDWIRRARGRTRLVGVCFGHQAMAQALGGHVEKSERGWGVGLHRYRVVEAQPWMSPLLPEIALSCSHQDQVVVKPDDARVILASGFTPFAGLAWDDDAISLQPHPEFSRAFTGALVEGRRGRIEDAVVDQAAESLKTEDDRAVVGDWIGRFLVG